MGAEETPRHGGELVFEGLRGLDVPQIFTLSGGHIFPVLDAAHRSGVRIVDVRHEQTAVFAAEGFAKCTGKPAVAVLTAGPGVTNGVSAITTAHFNGSPVIVLGGRAAQSRWGSGSLQELDHVPILAPVTKWAATVTSTAGIPEMVARAAAVAGRAHRGPVFLDIPLDVLFGSAAPGGTKEPASSEAGPPDGAGEADPDEVLRAAKLLAVAERPVVIAGSDVYWGGASAALRGLVEELRLPVFMNGLGRGTIAADHELAFSRARSLAREADVVAVVGTPLDFRLGFGRFGAAEVVHVVDHPEQRATHARVAASPAGDIASILETMTAARGLAVRDHEPWIERLRGEERTRRSADEALLTSGATPIHPARVYGELRRLLDRDAVVVGDGGDFVSYAGRFVDSFEPGCFLDPGPFGCLGTGPGYAMAARLARPSSQVVLCAGDGAFGFAGLDVDSMVRHRLPVAIVVGNNGIWGLEKHPMRAIYGYDVAADLQAGCRYDEVVRALGGAGETVSEPSELGPALERAISADEPYLVNVLTDPGDAYPRTSNLA